MPTLLPHHMPRLNRLSFDPGSWTSDEVEIQVSHCGICHSDLSMLDNEWGMSTFPFVPGHEAVGTVVALGEKAKGLQIGQRVGVGWFAQSCLSCYECLSGHHNRCARGEGTMVGRHGGFADRLRVQWTWARPLPDALDPAKAGPLFCGGITVFCAAASAQPALPPRASESSVLAGSATWRCNLPTSGAAKSTRFTTSHSKEARSHTLGAHYGHNTRRDGELKNIAASLDPSSRRSMSRWIFRDSWKHLRPRAFFMSWARCSNPCRFPPSL